MTLTYAQRYVVGFMRNQKTLMNKGDYRTFPSCRSTRPRTRGER
jgi:hypothetical protein